MIVFSDLLVVVVCVCACAPVILCPECSSECDMNALRFVHSGCIMQVVGDELKMM